eukprot:PhM_4_TR4195/c0_g1_i1/m.82627/K08824/CDKL; cyclin-dependent kinase-like
MEMYETLGVIGEGTYGVVVKARHKETQQLVAIKKFKESDDDEQVRKTSLREIRMLKNLRHFNIVNLLEVFRRKQKLYLVFEFIDRTILELLEKKPYGLDEAEVKKYTYQLLRAADYCHRSNVIHRDIKPENILIGKNGVLKLCDFGFARSLGGAGAKYTDYVATRWYRSPELLVGDTEYSRPVDIWAIGCIFAEIATGMPLFPGESDVDQLHHIIRCFGRLIPRHEQIFKRNPLYSGIELPVPKMLEPLEVRYGGATHSKVWLQFLKSCLRPDPEARETCQGLMDHPYFDKGFRAMMEEEMEKMERQERAQNSWWAQQKGEEDGIGSNSTTQPHLSMPPTGAHAGKKSSPTPPTVSDNHPSLPTVQPSTPYGNMQQQQMGAGHHQHHQSTTSSSFASGASGVATSSHGTRQPLAMFGPSVSLGNKTPSLGLFGPDFNVVKGKKNSGPSNSTTMLPTLGTTTSNELKLGYKKKPSPVSTQPGPYGLGLYQGLTGTTILHPGGSMKAPSTSHSTTRTDSFGGSRRGSKPWDPK